MFSNCLTLGSLSDISLLASVHPAVYPSNQQFLAVLPEILKYGYKPSYGAVIVKFPHRARDGSRSISSHSVGIVDGYTKILAILGILIIVKELELEESELNDPTLKKTLESFDSIFVSYKHYDHPAHYYLESLRTLACRFCLTSNCLVFECFWNLEVPRFFNCQRPHHLRSWIRDFWKNFTQPFGYGGGPGKSAGIGEKNEHQRSENATKRRIESSDCWLQQVGHAETAPSGQRTTRYVLQLVSHCD